MEYRIDKQRVGQQDGRADGWTDSGFNDAIKGESNKKKGMQGSEERKKKE